MRVLITFSQLDGSVQDRIEQISNSPRLRDHVKSYFFIWHDSSRSLTKLEERLAEKIEDFRPDIVVVHGGWAFYANEDEYITRMNSIIRAYPEVTFVADGALLARTDFEGKMPFEDIELFNLVMRGLVFELGVRE
jgi:hypothetical protein